MKTSRTRTGTCACGRTITWRRYMKYGIVQICPRCGAWWRWDSTGLHITKKFSRYDGKFMFHALIPNHLKVKKIVIKTEVRAG